MSRTMREKQGVSKHTTKNTNKKQHYTARKNQQNMNHLGKIVLYLKKEKAFSVVENFVL